MSGFIQERLTSLRSLLFIPATGRRHLAAAPRSGADAFVVDLEDSIAQSEKAAARVGLKDALAHLPETSLCLVRVNADERWMRADLDAVVEAGGQVVLIPKVESVAMLGRAGEMLAAAETRAGIASKGEPTRIVAGIESPKGVVSAREIVAARGRIAALGFGCDDYAGELGVPASMAIVDYAAQEIAVSARSMSLAALGIPGSIADVADIEGFRRLVHRARMMGFTGHFCIHPSQCAAVRAEWLPPAAMLAWAREVLEAKAGMDRTGAGGAVLDGRMIDAAVVRQAQAILVAAGGGEEPAGR